MTFLEPRLRVRVLIASGVVIRVGTSFCTYFETTRLAQTNRIPPTFTASAIYGQRLTCGKILAKFIIDNFFNLLQISMTKLTYQSDIYSLYTIE